MALLNRPTTVFAFVCIMITAGCGGPPGASKPSPPAPAAPVTRNVKDSGPLAGADLAKARALFDAKCATCHTKTGVGDHHHKKDGIPSFTDAAWQQRAGDDEIVSAITNGTGRVMPAFKGRLSDDEIRLLARYVRGFPERQGAKGPGGVPPGGSHGSHGSHGSGPADGRYTGAGVVTRVDRAKGLVTIDHGDIPGYMSAMRMSYDARNAAMLDGIAANDPVTFTVEVAKGDETLVAIEKRGGAR